MILLSVTCISVLYADNTNTFYDEVEKNIIEIYEDSIQYLSEVAHDISTDDITFESFYKDSSSIGWILAAAAALIAIVVIFITGGTASPIVVSIGTWIGGTMGLSGVAATNAGLALLGGGSIASGGFGVIGGTALLTGALTFGTEVIIDYSLGKAINKYSYSNFSKDSKNMITLPLPKNADGCDSYQEAITLIEDIDTNVPISSENTQETIRMAINILKMMDEEDLDLDEKAKKEGLYALLYFIANDFKKSKNHAELSIKLSKQAKVKHTLPSYIFATSSLYDESFNYNDLVDKYLKYSFVVEPDNPIIPLLLAIHLDRMMYRFGDGSIDASSLNKVFQAMADNSLREYRIQNYIAVLSRYIIRLKLEQQKISSLTSTNNKAIKNSFKTLFATKQSFVSYEDLMLGASQVIKTLDYVEIKGEKEAESKKEIQNFNELLTQYANDRTRLQKQIDELEIYQASLEEQKITEVKKSEKKPIERRDNNSYIYIGLGILFLFFILFFIQKHKRKNKRKHLVRSM